MVDDPDVLDGIEAKELDSKTRKGLGNGQFAVPSKRALPIHDASHVRNALARFNQTQGLTPAEKSTARARIRRAAKKFGVSISAELDDVSAESAVPQIAAMAVLAASITIPDSPGGHINRMPFTGVLVRLDVASDNAPHGTNGKRIILPKDVAASSVHSLIGMGVDLKQGLDGHDAANKVGIVTDARVDGDSVTVEGFIWANDHPKSALAIQRNKSDLGMSFEAANIGVRSLQDDILTITKLTFTGCAVLLKESAAFRQTAIAAAAAKEHEMDEIQEAVAKAIEAALGPLNTTLADIAAAQAAQAATIDELKKTPEIKALEANAAMVGRVEPHAAGLEAAADRMEQEGIGVAPTSGHTHHLRRMAGAMRGDSARGKLPDSYHDSGSYWAGADHQQQQQHTEDDDVIVKDTPEFKELKASADKTADDLKQALDALKQQKEESASMATMLKDMKASIDGLRPSPQRKTMAPEIASILARANLTMPEEEGGTIAIGKIDAALANMPGMDTSQRMYLKTMLSKAGVIGANGQ